VVISTPMSEYKKIILKLNKNLGENSLMTDVGSTRGNVAKLIKEKVF
jgi:prephenate dehydrogenase